MITTIVTMPPYAPYMEKVLRHKIVSGIRLNTVMPVTETLEDVLKRMNDLAKKYDKTLYIDLKARQLRIKTYGIPPFTEIELTHNIKVNTPVRAYFGNGEDYATVLKVDKNRLIMQEGPKRMVGPGESVNIPDTSLHVDGYLTDTDKKYIEAAKKIGLHDYILSFVETKNDIEELIKLDKESNIIAKIESVKGMDYVVNQYSKEKSNARLMAARGDLYIELGMPHEVIDATEKIIKKDNDAIVASRIFTSLSRGLQPCCEDIGDADNLLRMGYRTLMFGDDICLREESVMSGLNLLYAMAEKYQK